MTGLAEVLLRSSTLGLLCIIVFCFPVALLNLFLKLILQIFLLERLEFLRDQK